MDSFDSSAVKYHPEKADIYRPEETIAGFTSVSLSRGRTAGYGLYFSRTRIIGVRKRRTSLVFGLALTLPLLVLLLYLNFLLGLSGPPYATFLLLFLPILSDQAIRRLRRVVPERIVRKSNPRTTNELGSKLDFELRREEISELLMKHVTGGSLSKQPGYLRIVAKDPSRKPIEIKITEIKELRELRKLVIEFAARQPQVRALEY